MDHYGTLTALSSVSKVLLGDDVSAFDDLFDGSLLDGRRLLKTWNKKQVRITWQRQLDSGSGNNHSQTCSPVMFPGENSVISLDIRTGTV